MADFKAAVDLVPGLTYQDLGKAWFTDAEKAAYDQSHAADEMWMMDHGEHPHRSCASCHRPDPAKHCGGCGSVAYCNAQCQRKHWKQHQFTCARLESTPFAKTRPFYRRLGFIPHVYTHLGKIVEPATRPVFEANLLPGSISLDCNSFVFFLAQYMAGKPFRDSPELKLFNVIYEEATADLEVKPSVLTIRPAVPYPRLHGVYGWNQQTVIGPFGRRGLQLDPNGEFWLGMSHTGYKRMTTVQWAWEFTTDVHEWAKAVVYRGRPMPQLPLIPAERLQAYAAEIIAALPPTTWTMDQMAGSVPYSGLTANLSHVIAAYLLNPEERLCDLETFNKLRE